MGTAAKCCIRDVCLYKSFKEVTEILRLACLSLSRIGFRTLKNNILATIYNYQLFRYDKIPVNFTGPKNYL